MAQPASFMSYALVDDSDGRLQQFRAELEDEVLAHLGEQNPPPPRKRKCGEERGGGCRTGAIRGQPSDSYPLAQFLQQPHMPGRADVVFASPRATAISAAGGTSKSRAPHPPAYQLPPKRILFSLGRLDCYIRGKWTKVLPTPLPAPFLTAAVG